MQKLKLLLVRLAAVMMLSCSLVPSIPIQVPDLSQPVITAEASTSYNKATIKKVQKKLNRLGYNCGTPDGIRGSKTNKAIRQYQRDHGLKVTGTVNSALLKSLNIEPVKDSAASSSSVQSSNTSERTVYITNTGSKYHRDGCRYLRQSKRAISKSNALAAGYDACSVCRP